jgi:hypothetical protein
MPIPVHYPIGFPVHYEVADFEGVELAQLHAFSQPVASGGGIIGPPVAVAAELTALAQGQLDAILGTVGGIHSSIGDANGEAGWSYRPDSGSTSVVELFYRDATTIRFFAHDTGSSFVADSVTHLWYAHLDTSPADQTMGMDASDTSQAVSTHITGTPTTTPEHKLGTNADGTNKAAFTGMQWAVIDRVLADPDEAAGKVLAVEYGGLGAVPIDPDLASLPIPEAGLLATTPLDGVYWRDQDAEIDRVTVATPNDGTLVGTPYSDWATAYKNGADAFTDANYVTLATGKVTRAIARTVTFITKITTPSSWSARDHVILVRDTAGADGFAFLVRNGGAYRTQTLSSVTTNQAIDTVSTLALATTYWVVSKYDLDNDTITSQFYTSAGSQVDTRSLTHADVSDGTFNTDMYCGRAANTGSSMDGTLHEMMVFEGFVLADAEIIDIIDGTDVDGTAGGKRTRHYVGFSAGVQDLARPTALYIPEVLPAVNPVTVAHPTL